MLPAVQHTRPVPFVHASELGAGSQQTICKPTETNSVWRQASSRTLRCSPASQHTAFFK